MAVADHQHVGDAILRNPHYEVGAYRSLTGLDVPASHVDKTLVARSLAAAGQFNVVNARLDRRLMDQRSGWHLDNDIGGQEADSVHTIGLLAS
ncbi:MAG: hypothetical protein ABSD43_09510 [Terracidiphilus sp.]